LLPVKKESPDNAAQIYGTSEKMEQMKKRNPMRKVGKGVDIENVVSFVIGRLFFWITGQVLAVDGRMSTQKI
jgi:3-oxoacyl-[acyl-carrier protein] reductase